jgi:hypothetical protein
MGGYRWNRAASWIVTAAVGAVWAVYFIDPTRYAALTQTAGWFLKAARILIAGGE